MATQFSFMQRTNLADQIRQRFLSEAGKMMKELADVVQQRLSSLMNLPSGGSKEMQDRRDAGTIFFKVRNAWVDGTVKAWEESLKPVKKKTDLELEDAGLELVGTDVVENKIVASRLVMEVADKVKEQLDDLRLRIKFLEGIDDFGNHDILRPEVSILLMIEKWAECGMPRESWPMVNDVTKILLIDRLKTIYQQCNDALINQGVMPKIDLKDRVKRLPPGPRSQHSSGADSQLPKDSSASEFGLSSYGESKNFSDSVTSRNSGLQRASGYGPAAMPPGKPPAKPGGLFGGRLGWGTEQGALPPTTRPGGVSGRGGSSAYGPHEETRMMTQGTPLARSHQRAQGVMGQLKRLFVGQVGGADFIPSGNRGPSPGLAAAIAQRFERGVAYFGSGGGGGGGGSGGWIGGGGGGGTVYEDYSPAGVVRVAGQLREQTSELKKKAETKNEKAIIEIVALMFQAILAEERIPTSIRVWFARLQMPVLRVALAEPEFFGTLNHPARQLIDRMGSCVMGFDATGINGSAMEAEIKRVVQVIEQYPETGKKVFQIVYDEFQKFLAKFLTGKESTLKVVSVAQQVEQKETMAIQYTIEMRNMLKDMPVRDEIRTFLFKVWAEVLAVAAIRKGPQHVDTISLKKSASDLVWSASAKPSRTDRAKVIQDLPNLLQRLRSGMGLLGMAPSIQDAHIKAVSDTLADAFMSKTQAIPQAQIDAMTKRLANLEDFVNEDGLGDLPLDAESIEMMLGIDASTIEVVTNGGSKPTAAMVAWAQELQTGAWFSLDHNGKVTLIQFVWRSDRKHLNLFAASDGRSFLIQAGRLAAYLQAGLLLPQEEETLTVRATRDALTKLEANPERLLGNQAPG
jgi:hypothetical protein